jgi:hypothetical protein
MAELRVIVVVFKKSGNIKLYGSLPAFMDEYEEYTHLEDTINYRLSRLKTLYEDDLIKLYRKKVKRGKRSKK